MEDIQKPKRKSRLRQMVGKEYYILKRKVDWFLEDKKWVFLVKFELYEYIVFKHKSIILRPLKNVDMYLQKNKRKNLELAIKNLDRIIINPKENFSFWKLVGRPTKRKGYIEGLILNQGRIDKDTGGGLCQLGNLLFWLFAHSPLTITERYRHSFDVFPDLNREVPFGAGATLSYNYIDLQVRNDTTYSFQLNIWLDEKYLNGQLLSSDKITDKYTIEERNHLIKQQFWGGYSRHNQIIKIEIDGNGNKNEKLLVENHALMMYNPFLSGKL